MQIVDRDPSVTEHVMQGVADLRSSTINIVEEVASTSGINAGFCLCASSQTTSTDSDTSSTSSVSDSNSVNS